MGFLDDIEHILEVITNTSTPQASAVSLIEWILTNLQSTLNAPDQHAKLQQLVNVLTEHKNALSEAVAAQEPQVPQVPA